MTLVNISQTVGGGSVDRWFFSFLFGLLGGRIVTLLVRLIFRRAQQRHPSVSLWRAVVRETSFWWLLHQHLLRPVNWRWVGVVPLCRQLPRRTDRTQLQQRLFEVGRSSRRTSRPEDFVERCCGRCGTRYYVNQTIYLSGEPFTCSDRLTYDDYGVFNA